MITVQDHLQVDAQGLRASANACVCARVRAVRAPGARAAHGERAACADVEAHAPLLAAAGAALPRIDQRLVEHDHGPTLSEA